MENEKKIKMLQMFYASALADSVLRFGKEGVLEKVTSEKRQEQIAGGKARAAQLGIESPCNIYCLDAMEGLINGLDENAGYEVLSTLWSGNACKVVVKTGK